ncbi:MAG: lysophospholipid acyltransferase family protein [Bacteroidota bacterium]
MQIACFILRIDPQRTLTQLTTLWARTMLWILNVNVTARWQSDVHQQSPHMIVANHQSYVDVIIIASIMPTLFVAKDDVRSWPVFGWLASLGGTLFIDRKAFRGALHSMEQIAKALRCGINVQVFPEGTSTNGSAVLPFRSALFNAAISSCSAILPLSVNYESINSSQVNNVNRDFLCWYGEMTFTNHFWRLLSLQSAHVSVVIHPSIRFGEADSAKTISQAAFSSVVNGFRRIE